MRFIFTILIYKFAYPAWKCNVTFLRLLHEFGENNLHICGYMRFIARVPKPCIMALQKCMLHFLPPGGGKTVVILYIYIYTHIYIYWVSPGLTLLAGYFINPCHLRPAWLRGLSIALGVLVSLSRQLLLPPLGTGFDALFRSLGRVAGSPKMARLWTSKMAPNCLS